jgi:hypothetical protein
MTYRLGWGITMPWLPGNETALGLLLRSEAPEQSKR